MNVEKLREDFWRDGYVMIGDFFGTELMERMDVMIRRHFGDDPEFLHEPEFLEQSKTDVIPWFPQNADLPEFDADAAAPFDEPESDEGLRELTQAILGAGWSQLYSMVMFSQKGTNGQAWHQDCPPENAAEYNLNRLVYTRDLSSETGGQVVVIPGSHRFGELPAGEPNENLPGQVVLSPRTGTLVLLHGHTWHRVLPITASVRFSTNYRACPAGTPDDVTDICVYRNMRYRFSNKTVIENRIENP